MGTRHHVPLIASLALAIAACSGSGSGDNSVCAEQASGTTADGAAVTICNKIFASAPMVRLPGDDRSSAVQTIHGVVELDIGTPAGKYTIIGARLLDRKHAVLELLDTNGVPIDETNALMVANKLPSNRPHFLIYEAKGTVSGTTMRLQSLRPIVLVTGRAIDERLLGVWEGTFSQYEGDGVWLWDQTAKVRVEFTALIPHQNFPELFPAGPILADGTRFKVVGAVANGERPVRLSTGECAQSLLSYGEHNPLTGASDYLFTLWRFPAMHTASSSDFHIVNDYPRKLYDTIGMAPDHNFRLADYIAENTAPMAMLFNIHGNPIGQFQMVLKPITGGAGGQAC